MVNTEAPNKEAIRSNLESNVVPDPEKLDRLAEVAIHVGLGLQRGQELVMTATLESLPLARRITEHAYKAGATLVTTLFTDEDATLMRFEYAPDESFDKSADWLFDGIAQAFRSGAARLAIAGSNPALLAGQDPQKVSRSNLALSKAYRPALDLITRHEINWTIVPCATPAWAAQVFPRETPDNAMTLLWDAIFAATRVNSADAVQAWKRHDEQLHARANFLNQRRFHALRFRSPGTDLTVGLADGHLWLGGGTIARNGAPCIPNMPTEEVFTTPHKDRVEGVVRATKPLSYQGMLIENISVKFKDGRIVEASASAGEAVLKSMLETDDGAARLGEVALVPASSPISKSGLLFWNTLFDENAACHIALGQAYSTCVSGGDEMTPAQLAEHGANDSLIHVDWMIGSEELDVAGLDRTGAAQPLIRQGEWVI